MPPWWPWLLRLRLAAARSVVVVCGGALARLLVDSWTAFVVGVTVCLVVVVAAEVVGGPGRVDAVVAWALRQGRPPPGLPSALVDAEAARRCPSRWSSWWGPAVAVLGPLGVVVLVVTRGPGGPPTAVAVLIGLLSVVAGLADWLFTREARRWTRRATTVVPGAAAR